ncbi:MAG: PhzF family phenazine biosynthesis protein [Nitrospirota bacterium]|nr:PhzF family phenazine biosynthesis protein [Nitrospirota bacterium]
MTTPVVQVDAFTDKPFCGNPAAVCILEELKDDAWMQNVAREMNLSETAFLIKNPDTYDLRWFTPAAEVDLCGHATLASAHVLWENGQVDRGQAIRFMTKSGLLTCAWKDGWIEMDFPAEPEHHDVPPRELIDALGVTPVYTGRNRLNDWLVEIESETVLRRLAPDFSLLAAVPMRGVMVTARSVTRGYDFISRFFAPRVNIAEDPVTGSAHCCLGPYWQKRLKRYAFYAWQASARGGEVHVRVAEERVLLSGKAITVMVGTLQV